MAFSKAQRLTRRDEFLRVIRVGQRLSLPHMNVEYCQRKGPRARLGITVPKKYGKAHDRNRFKRVVRAAFQQVANLLPIGMDIHIRPSKGGVVPLSSTEVAAQLMHLAPTPISTQAPL